MNIREACDVVLGEKLAASIIANQGLRWAALAAMADCKAGHGPAVKAAISSYFAELKQQGGSG